ncbi:AAA family ATPase [uncultured virus]|nr:AAA family ATPase [uncultured virus]
MADQPTKPIMIILRGCPGAGKTTIAEKCFPDYVKCSADDHFMKNGVYYFNRYEIQLAHDNCYAKAKKALADGKNVIVDNTNRKLDEFKRYLDLSNLTSKIRICKVVSQFQSTKPIPDHVIPTFHREYQRHPEERQVKMGENGELLLR